MLTRSVGSNRPRGSLGVGVGLATVLVLAAGILALASPAYSAGLPNPGLTWTSRTSAADHNWWSVAYGNGTFVAVSDDSTDVMTSTDGVAWQLRDASAAGTHSWDGVAFGRTAGGGPIFVAVAFDGAVMRSADGITWASATSSLPGKWTSVAYSGANGKFVAVGQTGTANSAMRTTDGGNTWTSSIIDTGSEWHSVSYGNGVHVATAFSGPVRLARSTNGGATFVPATTIPDSSSWWASAYGGGKFVAVASDGSDQVLHSADGNVWQKATTVPTATWRAVTYGNGTYVAVGASGEVMTSTDAITWVRRTSPNTNNWLGVTYESGIFVATGDSGVNNRVMTSGDLTTASAAVAGVLPPQGPTAGGTSITVSGAGFIPGASVTVGGKPCGSVAVTASTTLTCLTPAGSAGKVSVAVTNRGEAPASKARAYTYVAPAPTVSRISPNEGSVLGGTRITLSGTNLAGMTAKVGGRTCSAVAVNAAGTSAKCTVPAGTTVGAVNVVVTTSGGDVTITNGFTYTKPTTNHVPNRPRAVHVVGSPLANQFAVLWQKPTMTSAGRPVTKYYVTITQAGFRYPFLQKDLPATVTKFGVTRDFLLSKTVLNRGDVRNTYRYRVTVQGANSLGLGPAALAWLTLKA